MIESLENRQLMSATLMPASTANISDGTSNTIMVAETYQKPGKSGGSQHTYLVVTMEDVLISCY